MGMTDQIVREVETSAEAPLSAELEAISEIIEQAREAAVSEDDALEAIGRVVRRHPAAEPETYQKPWG